VKRQAEPGTHPPSSALARPLTRALPRGGVELVESAASASQPTQGGSACQADGATVSKTRELKKCYVAKNRRIVSSVLDSRLPCERLSFQAVCRLPPQQLAIPLTRTPAANRHMHCGLHPSPEPKPQRALT